MIFEEDLVLFNNFKKALIRAKKLKNARKLSHHEVLRAL